MEFFVNHNTNALLALAETESSSEFNLVAEILFSDKSLKRFNNLAGTLEMAGTAYSNCDFHDVISLLYINYNYILFIS